VNAWLILADYAQVQLSKLYIVGGGVSLTGPGLTSMGVAAQLVVPWQDRSKQIPLRIALLRADDREVVQIEDPVGNKVNVEVSGAFEAVPAPGSPQGSDIVVAFAFSLANTPLAPGSYVWELYVSNEVTASAHAAFAVRALGSPIG
jgi:hypothetical protein